MYRTLLSTCGWVIVLVTWFSPEVQGQTIAEAERLSQQTGRPMLVVVGRATCGNTTALVKDLSNPALASALSQYVNVQIDVDKPEWGEWQRKYGHPEGSTLPYVYVIRSDGEKILLRSGFVETPQVRALVTSQASKGGRVLSPQELAVVEKALEAAKKADAAEDLGAGIKALTGAKKFGVMSGAACYARPVVDANHLVDEWTEKGRARLKEAEEQLTSEAATFGAALEYLQAKRTYSPLPGLKKELASATRKIDKNRKLAELLRQAESVQRAHTLAATRDGRKKAIDAFSRITADYPDSDAAKFASEELQKLKDGLAKPDEDDKR